MASSEDQNNIPTQIPKDAVVIEKMLKEQGISEFEPRVVNQLLEFTHRYVSKVLEDAKTYSNHANKKSIDPEDIRLAIQMQFDKNFVSPYPREMLLELAKNRNSTPLPFIKPQPGLRLPADRWCLTACNYRLKNNNQKKFSQGQSAGTGPCYGLKLGVKGSPAQTLLVKRPAGPPPTLALQRTQPSSKSVLKISTANLQSSKMQPKIQIGSSGIVDLTNMKYDNEEVVHIKNKDNSDEPDVIVT